MKVLTAAEIKEAVALESPSLVKEVYELVQRQLQSEAARQTILDGKANSLLTAVGLSLTLSISIGYQMVLGQQTAANSMPQWYRNLLVIVLTLGTGFALASSIHAIYSLRVSKCYRAVNAEDIFNKDILRLASSHGATPDAGERSVTIYRRYLMPQLWDIVQNDFMVHERKATIVKRGQNCFLAFVVSLVALSGLIALRVALQR